MNFKLASCVALGLVLLAATSDVASGNGGGSTRILGGVPVRPGEMPFMANILIEDRANVNFFLLVCGGSILDKKHILTAASCMFADDGIASIGRQLLRVQVGCIDLRRCNSAKLRVAEIMIYPTYKDVTKHDIAILRLDEEIDFGSGTIGNVNLATEGDVCCDERIETLTVVGWGGTRNGAPPSGVLLKVDVNSIPLADCKKLSSSINSDHICAGGQGKGPCRWDEGGPLLMRDASNQLNQVGIVSFGRECGSEEGGVYTKVANYRNWIRRCLRNECDKLPLI